MSFGKYYPSRMGVSKRYDRPATVCRNLARPATLLTPHWMFTCRKSLRWRESRTPGAWLRYVSKTFNVTNEPSAVCLLLPAVPNRGIGRPALKKKDILQLGGYSDTSFMKFPAGPSSSALSHVSDSPATSWTPRWYLEGSTLARRLANWLSCYYGWDHRPSTGHAVSKLGTRMWSAALSRVPGTASSTPTLVEDL